jgi:RimJ/RimL family protein N-acetyltransferase
VLRPPQPSDAQAIRQACQDPDIQRWIPAVPSPYTDEDAGVFVAWSEQGWRTGERASFVICDSGSDELLGTLGLGLDRREHGVASIGYWLAREARGRGVATEAVKLGSRWAFRELGIERLELYTETGNEPSQRVAERAGFTREGIARGHLRTSTGRRDSVIFSLLPGDL